MEFKKGQRVRYLEDYHTIPEGFETTVLSAEISQGVKTIHVIDTNGSKVASMQICWEILEDLPSEELFQ